MRRLLVCFCLHILLLAGFCVHPAKAVPFFQNRTAEPGFLSDTTKKKPATGVGADSAATLTAQQISIRDSLKKLSDMEAPIEYSATDSMILDMDSMTLYLTRGAQLTYQKMNLKADSIGVDWRNNTLTAAGRTDSTGKVTGKPEFADDDQKYNAGFVKYNYKSQKGIVDFGRTKQGDDYVLGERIKKDGPNTYYIKNGMFTTCDLEHPHFYIKSSKLKIVPRKQIISGPLHLVIEGFPLPVVVPFGFFPNTTGKRSGILFPTYGEAADRGFFLRGLGYYWAVNDNLDLSVQGDVFSKGGFGLAVGSNYKWKYHFEGNLDLRYGVQQFGERTDPDYRVDKNFSIAWRHDQPINPQTRLRANVKVQSAGFNRANSYVDRDYLTNTLVSNITLNKTFPNSPWSAVVNLDHNQNTNTRIMTLGLPNASLARSRWYPFRGKSGSGAWYEKIGLTYSANFNNKITAIDTFIDNILLHPRDTIDYVTVSGTDTIVTPTIGRSFFQNGMVQNLPINTSINIGSFLTFAPSFQYREYWYFKTIRKEWNGTSIDKEDVQGFATARDFSTGANLNTRIYGFYYLKNKRETTFRHTMTPTVGFTYRPDFADDRWGYYADVQRDTLGNTQRYSRFEGLIFGGPGAGEQQALNFNLANQVEMKLLSQKFLSGQDTAGMKDKFTRLTVIDNIGLSGSYNLAADSFNLSNLNVQARSSLFQNKFTVQSNMVFNPYWRDTAGRMIDMYRWESGRFPALEQFELQLSTGIRSKPKEKLNTDKQPADEMATIAYYRSLYVDFNIPWSVGLNANLRYTQMGKQSDTLVTVSVNGDFNLTPKWKIVFNTGYDFIQKDFSYTTIDIHRDLHCWDMSFRWIPFGQRKSYNFAINVKSPTLRDLKLTRRRDWQDRFVQ